MEKNETKMARTDCEIERETLVAAIANSKTHHEGDTTHKDFWHDNLAGGFDADISVLMYHITQDPNKDDGEEQLKEADKPREGFRNTTGDHFE